MPIVCKTCGEHMDGDGYKVVLHCPHADEAQVACAEPDANPIHCQESLMTESTVTRYADLLNVLCDMQVSPAYAARKQVLSDAENAIVFLEKEVDRLTKENERLSGKQEHHPAFAFTGFIPDEDTRRNDAAFEASRTMVRVTPAMIAALDRNLVGQVAQSREQLLGHALQAALAYLPPPVPADAAVNEAIEEFKREIHNA